MAVVHGPRESIDVFQVDTRPATPSLTWVGCVIAPGPIGLNSVRGLADGGFITTNWLPRGGAPDAMQKMMGGEKNGELWEWHTASGWQKVPGSEAAGANGIELSDDGKTIYMAAWGSQSFIRLSRGATPPKRDEIPLGFRVDNIHFARDGTLLAAGQITDPGNRSSRVVKVDPKTLAVRDSDPAGRCDVRGQHDRDRGRQGSVARVVSRGPDRDRSGAVGEDLSARRTKFATAGPLRPRRRLGDDARYDNPTRGDGIMSKTSIASAAAALLAFASVCSAQPPGITPEMIARALPLEGAPLAEPGPYEVTRSGFRLARPHGLSPDEARRVPQERHAARRGLG